MSGVCRVAAGIVYTQIVGVAEDQSLMTRCNLAVWVKNGHNIYPQATPLLWARAVDADRRVDCAPRYAATLAGLAVFVALWLRHVWHLVRSGIDADNERLRLQLPP